MIKLDEGGDEDPENNIYKSDSPVREANEAVEHKYEQHFEKIVSVNILFKNFNFIKIFFKVPC